MTSQSKYSIEENELTYGLNQHQRKFIIEADLVWADNNFHSGVNPCSAGNELTSPLQTE